MYFFFHGKMYFFNPKCLIKFYKYTFFVCLNQDFSPLLLKGLIDALQYGTQPNKSKRHIYILFRRKMKKKMPQLLMQHIYRMKQLLKAYKTLSYKSFESYIDMFTLVMNGICAELAA